MNVTPLKPPLKPATLRDLPERGPTESADWRVASRTVLFAIAVLVLIWVLINLKGVLIRVLLAIIFASGMSPLVDRVAVPWSLGRGRVVWTPPRALVVLALYVLLFAALFLAGRVVVPPLIGEVEHLLRKLPEYLADFQAWAATLAEGYPFIPPL